MYNKRKSNTIKLKDIVYLDIETSVLDTDKAEIVAFRALVVKGDGECEVYNEFARPKVPLDEYIEKFIGITNNMLEGCRDSELVKKDIIELVKDSIVVSSGKSYVEKVLGIELKMFIDSRDFYKKQFESSEYDEMYDEIIKACNNVKPTTAEVQRFLFCSYKTAVQISKAIEQRDNS